VERALFATLLRRVDELVKGEGHDRSPIDLVKDEARL